MRNVVIKVLIIVFIFVLILFGLYKLMNSRTFQLFGGLTNHVETNEKVVALTFDDGPTKNVDAILSLLEAYKAKATFFLIGNDLEKNLLEGKKIADAGHQIGNHTFSHKRMIFKSPSFIKQELKKTNELIKEIGYKGEIDFRPPNGKKLFILPYILMKNHIDTITWDLEPDTYFNTVDKKVSYVIDNVKPGSIILLHPMYDSTGEELDVIRAILDQLTEEGYQFITIDELQKLGN